MKELMCPVSPELARAYRTFIATLKDNEKNMRIQSGDHVLTRAELPVHLENDDEIGREMAQGFLDGTRIKLREQGMEHLTDEDVEHVMIKDLMDTALRRRERIG